MAIDLEREVVAALASPAGRAALAEVFESVLDRRAAMESLPWINAQEAARLLNVRSKNPKAEAKALYERMRRDPALAKIKRILGDRMVFDRAALMAYISERTKGGG